MEENRLFSAILISHFAYCMTTECHIAANSRVPNEIQFWPKCFQNVNVYKQMFTIYLTFTGILKSYTP